MRSAENRIRFIIHNYLKCKDPDEEMCKMFVEWFMEPKDEKLKWEIFQQEFEQMSSSEGITRLQARMIKSNNIADEIIIPE